MVLNGILVLDFGGTEARAIARKVRGEHVFSCVLPYDATLEQIQECAPKGIILAGGEGDPFSKVARECAGGVYELGLPVLGFGYGGGVLMRHVGARRVDARLGDAAMQVTFDESELFEGLTESERAFERLDDVEPPEGFQGIATAKDGTVIAFENRAENLYALQFYPEPNDPDGLLILRNFARTICDTPADWTMSAFLDWKVEQIQSIVGDGRALITVSGGVDSAVCAALMLRAIGDRLTCVHVDTGLIRNGESELVRRYFDEQGVKLDIIDARERFLNRLRGVTDRERKRQAVYEEYEQIVEEAVRGAGSVPFLAQGTIYTDVLDGQTFLGGDREGLLEPLRVLFKEEVRDLGALMGLPDELVNRQAFPPAGLAVRCVGEVTGEKLKMVREADQIFREEIVLAGLDKRVRQFFAVLTDIRTSGLPDRGYAVALRAINQSSDGKATVYRLPYDLLERIVERITAEVPGVNRVVYDVTGMPPAAIEWD